MCSCGGEIDWVSAQQHECHSLFLLIHLPWQRTVPYLGSSARSSGMRRWGSPALMGPSELQRGQGRGWAQLQQWLCWQGAPLTGDQGSAPYEQNISTLQCNSALSCRRVMFSLREVRQEGLQDIGWGFTNINLHFQAITTSGLYFLTRRFLFPHFTFWLNQQQWLASNMFSTM